MRQHYISNDKSGDHFAVGFSSHTNEILLQVQQNGEQVRIPLNLEQSTMLVELLAKNMSRLIPESK